MANDLMQIIGRLRRDMPRNGLVMDVCDALEARLREPVQLAVPKKRDRTVYMREYMRRKRGSGVS